MGRGGGCSDIAMPVDGEQSRDRIGQTRIARFIGNERAIWVWIWYSNGGGLDSLEMGIRMVERDCVLYNICKQYMRARHVYAAIFAICCALEMI
jgi:hypothetical protein